MADQSLDPAMETRLTDAEQKGFIRGLNVGFVTIGTLAAVLVCWRLAVDLPKFGEVFKQVKVPIPGITLLVLQTRGPVAVLFLLLAGFCIWATRSRGEKRFTIVFNALLFGGALFWLFLVNMALSLPLVSLLEGIGQRR